MIIAIPLYRAPELIAKLFDTLALLAAEIEEIGGRILLINDSADDADLRAELDSRLPVLAAAVPVRLLENPTNLGFVRSANLALAYGRDEDEDVILLNSDALPSAGALREMKAVAYLDPMTVVVSPRSNNATICNSPYPERFRGRDQAASLRDHRAIAPRLSRVSYVPTAVGFCLYIRSFALREFGLFDEVYGQGYNEENDFIRRCNRRGYRAVLANRAFVWHFGNASFSQAERTSENHDTENRRILDQRYPEYDMVVRRYHAGPHYRAEYLASGLIPRDDGKLRVMFDCRLLGAHHNGTSQLTCRLLAAFAGAFADRYDVAVLTDAAAFAYHGLDGIAGLRACIAAEARDWPFAAAFRIGQPFTRDDLESVLGLAAVSGFLMLDTIALDCQQLDIHDLDSLWRSCAAEADILAYISRFSRDQFHRRFAVRAGTVETVALCSTDVEEYRPTSGVVLPSSGKTILVVGNHYPHKAIDETLAALRARETDIPVTVLGIETDDGWIESHRAGELSEETVDSLYANARVVLFPSHYEGFGLPIMQALAQRKPVVTRRRPATIEIAERTPHAANLHLFDTLDEMIDAALAVPDWIDVETPCQLSPQSWNEAARQIGNAIQRAIARYDHSFNLARQTRLLASAPQRRLRALPLAMATQTRPTLDAIRPDFDEILAMLDAYHGHGDSRWLDRLFRKAPRYAPHRARLEDQTSGVYDDIASLELVANACTGLWTLQLDLQRWVQRIAPGGRLLLRIEGADHVDLAYGAPTIDAILVLLVGAGCVPLSRFSDGTTISATAVKLLDWRESLDADDDDRAFVARCYTRILGREGDPGGVAHHIALLESHGREAIANGFYLSRERSGHISSRLSSYFGG